jgi:hypothetical protein
MFAAVPTQCAKNLEDRRGYAMKSSTFLFFALLLVQSAGDQSTLKARMTYIELFPFITSLGHQAMGYKQAAWIKTPDTCDSLVILFDRTTSGDDIFEKKITIDKIYQFTVKPWELTQIHGQKKLTSKPDSSTNIILSLPIVPLVDSNRIVKSQTFWIEVRVTEP